MFSSPTDERPIFVVDDDENDRTLFSQTLQDAGNHSSCYFFSTGEEMIDALLRVLQGAPPPLVCFLDIKMAGMSAFDVLRWIRLQTALAEVSVVLLSSSQDPIFLKNALRHGAQCYVEKIPDAGQFREILNEAAKFSAIVCGQSAFNVPCNLLPAEQPARSP